ncbi:MAG: DUF2155 domain-containing protein [Alphaproteobacteria bacterium]|nr:DUF2155 domain-containing protein [Alphaproteobacteria bacterium]
MLGFAASAVLLLLADPALADTVSEPTAVLEGLDKTTARMSTFEAPVGTPVRFGTLSILVRDCEKNPPEETPENAAFIEIDERRPGEETARLFSGWMFSSSPALSALEHPIYDVTVLDCKGANASPPAPSSPAPGSRRGKSAR